jgi:hypothetical protein
MEDRYTKPTENDDDERYLELSRRKINDYKEGLLQQIRDNEEKRHQVKLQQEKEEKAHFALI